MLMAFSGAGFPVSVTFPETEPAVEASTVFAGSRGRCRGLLGVFVAFFFAAAVMASATMAARARVRYLFLISKKSSLSTTVYSSNFGL